MASMQKILICQTQTKSTMTAAASSVAVLLLSLVVLSDPHPTTGASVRTNYHFLARSQLNDALKNATIQDGTHATSAPFMPNHGTISSNTKTNPTLSSSISGVITTWSKKPNKNTDHSDMIGNNRPNVSEIDDPGMGVGIPSSIFEVEADSNPGESSFKKLTLKLDRDYTPKEIAEYIFTTGDEKGISQAVSEMMQDGQMQTSKDNVIHFLEAVQKEVSNFKSRFHQSDMGPRQKRQDIYHRQRIIVPRRATKKLTNLK